MVVTCLFQWCHVEPSSNIRRTVEHFYEEFDHLKVAIVGSIMKRSVIFLVSTQWITVLLQGEVLHYLKMTVLSCQVQRCYSLTVQV
jgi:hypothetical protein